MAHFQDPFLKDLADLSDSEGDVDSQNNELDEVPLSTMIDTTGAAFKSDEQQVHGSVSEKDTLQFSRLKTDDKFLAHLEAVKLNNLTVASSTETATVAAADANTSQQIFDLINNTNEFLRQLHPEMQTVHKTARDLYLRRFRELESIITNPIDYARVVQTIGNDETIENLGQKLNWLSATAVLSVTVAFSAAEGTRLTGDEFAKLTKACEEIIWLDVQSQLLLKFLENRMHVIAPNTMALLGPSLCAKMISAAGGLTELSRTPASNIQVLGSQRKALHGMSSATAGIHMGHLGESPMVTNAPQPDKIKLVRMLSTKTAIASRVDACRTHPDGKQGELLKEGILARYAKISAPGQAKLAKILPKPEAKMRKKRGGAKMRNQKQKYEMTMQRKLQNTMAFGPDAQHEETQSGKGLGLLGIGGALRIQKEKKDKPNNLKKRPGVPMFGGAATATAGAGMFSQKNEGLVSTVAMTHTQGIELINPDLLKQKVSQAQKDNYFSDKTGFTTVLNMRGATGGK